VTVEDIDNTTLIDELRRKEYNETTFDCPCCNKQFNNKSSMYRHKKICDKNPTMQLEELKIRINEIEAKNKLFEEKCKNMANITNNTQINIHNNINIRNFGNENISHLPNEFLSWCFANKDIVKLMENIHCDKEHPENHNIRVKSQKRKQIETRENDRWAVKDEDDALAECIENGYRILVRHAWKHKDDIIENELDDEAEYHSIREWFESLYENHTEQKPIKRKLLLLFLSNQALLLGKDD